MTQPITRLNPASLPDAASQGYSQISIVEPGRMALISGQVAQHRDRDDVPEALADQAALVAQNAMGALKAVGAEPKDVAMARLYMVDMTEARLQEGSSVLLGMLQGTQPSVTGIGVAALADPRYQLELELIVRLPD